MYQTLTVVVTSLPITSLLFAVTSNSKKPSTKLTILLAVLNSPVLLSSLNTALWLAGTDTVSIMDGAREKKVELTRLYVIGWESESMSTASNVSREVSTGTFRRTPEIKTRKDYTTCQKWKTILSALQNQVLCFPALMHISLCPLCYRSSQKWHYMAQCYIFKMLLPLGSFYKFFLYGWYTHWNIIMCSMANIPHSCSKLEVVGKEYWRKKERR